MHVSISLRLACLPLGLEYKEAMYYNDAALLKNCYTANVCIPNIIQMMLVSFIPDANFQAPVQLYGVHQFVSLYSRE